MHFRSDSIFGQELGYSDEGRHTSLVAPDQVGGSGPGRVPRKERNIDPL
ncbi:MAG: hypothetical protein V2B19_04060 [Pseudomonadota bacterium]